MKLGDLDSSEKLIKELYVDLRESIKGWAKITHQTPQARMGYVGQHLVSVATGYQGGKSGARGYDLIMGANGEHGEIKTCYRVDQLGKCNNCSAVVASFELECSNCGSTNIERKDDSKWLIAIRHDDEFNAILDPEFYFLVLFEFVDLNNPEEIRAAIYKVDTFAPGFAYCMIDYYKNIRAKSKSKAPFNFWPYSLKFFLMRPTLIYESFIRKDNSIETTIFPGRDDEVLMLPTSLTEFSRSTNLSYGVLEKFADAIGLEKPFDPNKRRFLDQIHGYIIANGGYDSEKMDALAKALYFDDIQPHIPTLPENITTQLQENQLIEGV